MNPVYSLLESPHRWSILAGLAFLTGCVGAIAMIAYGWSHTLAQLWFYLGAIATAVFLLMAFIQWRSEIEVLLQQSSRGPTGESTQGED